MQLNPHFLSSSVSASSERDIPAFEDANYAHKVQGVLYSSFLSFLHDTLNPRSYLEIGVYEGRTLSLARCSSIGVDPNLRICSNIIGTKPQCHLFQSTSDVFFSSHNPASLLGRPLDLAFLDGMHLFEFLLRDFINVERFSHNHSVIVLHDCVPPGFYMTVRDPTNPLRKLSKFSNWWTGDVWRLLPILQHYRPNLRMLVADCAPTGLVLITNLEPQSTVLTNHYRDILHNFSQQANIREDYEVYWKTLAPSSSEAIIKQGNLADFCDGFSAF